MKKVILLFIVSSIVTSIYSQTLYRINCTTSVGDAMLGVVDTAKVRGVSDNYHTWSNGQVILVKFMSGGSQQIRSKVMACAKEWEKYANITFKFVHDTTALTNIRIKLGKGNGHNSAVGTEANFRPQTMQTMNFDTIQLSDIDYYLAKLKKKNIPEPYNYNHVINEMKSDPNHWDNTEIRRVVTHEFGHSLGLLHEQSFPGAVKWKKTDSIYTYYKETQGWDKAKVDFNVFEISNQFYTNGTKYDPLSIMHYTVRSWETTDGYSVTQRSDLSAGDKALIAALYPKDKKESDLKVAKVDVTNFGKLRVVANPAKKGLSFFPRFDLSTNSKLGVVYCVVRLATEDGYYLETDKLYYNWAGTLATYLKLKLLPDSKVSYNKSTSNVLELFIPYSELPDFSSQKLMFVFSIFLDDEVNGQMDRLMYFSTTTPMNVTK